MHEIENTGRPPLSDFDLSGVPEPDDGVLYCYESAVDGFWHVTADADAALQEATGYPVGELVEYELDGWPDAQADGEIHALFVDGAEPEPDYHFAETPQGRRIHIVDLSSVEHLVGQHDGRDRPSECGETPSKWIPWGDPQKVPEYEICEACREQVDPSTVRGEDDA